MHYTNITINNHKSFLSSPKIQLSKGLNLIVGKNNSGKTSFLEILSGQFVIKPHLNEKTKKRKTSIVQEDIIAATISLHCTKKRLLELAEDNGYNQELCLYNPRFIYYNEPEQGREGWHIYENIPDEDLGISSNLLRPVDNSELEEFFVPVLQNGLDIKVNLPTKGFYIPKLSNKVIPIKSNIDLVHLQESDSKFTVSNHKNISAEYEISNIVLKDFFEEVIFKFDVHRVVNSKSPMTSIGKLNTNCDNLPTVLDHLQNDSSQLQNYVKLVCKIFPEIKNITINKNGNDAEILIWMPQSTRPDLAIPLSDCGTGIGQVMAILHLVINSDSDKVIIIDEPNSFLHPSASRKLIELLKLYPNHQYFITSHSPEIISKSDANNILVLSLNDEGQTEISTIDKSSSQDIHLALTEVGVRLSDVFGYDQILWVEGKVEELCFPKIVEKIIGGSLTNAPILEVMDTGSFEKKHIQTTIKIYKKLINGNSLIPSALGFIFDRENRSQKDIDDLIRQGTIKNEQKVFFLKKRLYENYLLFPKAIKAILIQNDKNNSWSSKVTLKQIDDFLLKNKTDKKYWDNKEPTPILLNNWESKIHAAKLLEDLFKEFSNQLLIYRKVVHSVELTEWLIDNKPEELVELKELLSKFYSPE